MSETQQDRKDAAATRRRWVTLAEVVAVAGVIIAALTLWNGWSERNAEREDKIAAASTAAREKSRIDLTASVRNGGRALLLDDARYDIQDVSVTFPRALGIATQRPAADPLIQTSWFALPMLALTDGGADERTGRLPVLITLSYWDGDATRETRGIYDLIWKTHGRVGRGRVMQLDGLRIHERGGNQARLDTIWARAKP